MKNLLLSQLSQDDFKRLEPYLKITPFKQHSVLFEAEQEIKHVYFRRVEWCDARGRGDGRGGDGRRGGRRWGFGSA
ncbi:hypothetical protein [Bradyrhizobium sp. RDI18]|uniref:hypothetical protein n=1 Tax=Bradyrhizobium sp. RDI18 TaxID=3367400 RepID=UPI0037193604